MSLILSSLYIHPVKGCRGTSPVRALAQARGFVDDRRWMIVDGGGRFVSQRSHPALALVGVATGPEALVLDAPGRPLLSIPLAGNGGPQRAAAARDVTIWGDTVAAVDAGDFAAAWLGDVLGADVRLVHMPDATHRAVDPRYGAPGDEVSFADGYPYLVATTASLADLNARLVRPVPMDRFRPNLVIDGGAPFAEDGWRRLRIGEVTFRLVKPCVRCKVTTVDQATGLLDGPEPLRTLAGFHTWQGGAAFGMNAIAEGEGVVRAGDAVEVLSG